MTESILPELATEPFVGFLEKSLGSSRLEIFPLAGDASQRRYYRVVHLDESSVLMSWEPFNDAESYPFLSVHHLFNFHGVQVPQILAISPAEGLILMEDLGDLTLERKFWESQNQQVILPYYKQALDELIKIHYSCSKEEGSSTAFSTQFDVRSLKWEMNYTYENLLLKFCKIKISAAAAKELDEIFTDICLLLHEEPKVVCHRDYHSRNLMLKLGKMRVIDFQDARLGPIQYDLVSLLKDSYVDLDENLAQNLLQYYLEQATLWGASPPEWDSFFELYELQSIQRCFKACGSFASFYNHRKDVRYLRYIKSTMQKIKASLSKFSHYQNFENFLCDHGLFEHDFEQDAESS